MRLFSSSSRTPAAPVFPDPQGVAVQGTAAWYARYVLVSGHVTPVAAAELLLPSLKAMDAAELLAQDQYRVALAAGRGSFAVDDRYWPGPGGEDVFRGERNPEHPQEVRLRTARNRVLAAAGNAAPNLPDAVLIWDYDSGYAAGIRLMGGSAGSVRLW